MDRNKLINENRVLGCSDIIVKIRYRKQENHGTVTVTPEHLLHIQLHEPLTAIAPGQAAAFYKDDAKCRHQWLIEFAKMPDSVEKFAAILDTTFFVNFFQRNKFVEDSVVDHQQHCRI